MTLTSSKMKINEFLSDFKTAHKKELTELKFLEMLREHARNSHNVIKATPIYLQDDSKSSFFIVRPNEKLERSAFWIDKIIENLLSWKTYPDRRHCVRGFNTLDRIGNRSEAFVVIPFDSSRVGVCPEASFYRSFGEFKKFGIERLDNSGLTRWIQLIIEAINEVDPENKISFKEPNYLVDLKKLMAQVNDVITEHKASLRKKLKESDSVSDEAKIVLTDLLSRHVTDLEKYLDEKLDPHANGFNAVRVDSLAKSARDQEVWTSSPCLLIKRDTYIELHKKGTIT